MDIELESLRPVGGLLGLDGVMDDVKDLTILGVSAAAGYVGGEMLLSKAPYIRDQSENMKAGVAIVAGFAAGIGISRFHGPAGAGVGAGMVALGVVKYAKRYLPGLAGLGEGEELLLGNVQAEDWNPIPGQVDGVRDVEPGIASWGV